MDTKDIKKAYSSAKELFNNKEYDDAFKAFKKLSEQGYDPATMDIVSMYHKGEGIPKDLYKAIEYMNKLNKDYKYSNSLLGKLYIELGDIKKGVKFLEEAIKNGRYEDLVYLGATFEYGEYGNPIDYDKALEYYTRACKQGYKDGCISMAKILEEQNKSTYDYLKEQNIGILKTLFFMLFGKKGLAD